MIPEPIKERARKIDVAHAEKVRAELRDADALVPGADAVPWAGSPLAQIAFVKGLPGPAEATGGPAMSGADGEAALKAAEKLGYAADEVFFTLSRPASATSEDARARRLRLQLDAVGAGVVVAVDRQAAADLASAFGAQGLAFGRELRVLGRRLVAADGLEASLGDDRRKREVWGQMLAARREDALY